jgi:LDH2 family malate/lactate/ureidoglycolate dehydrogenase
MNSKKKYNHNDLRTFVETALREVGVSKENAEISADVMIEANLCGVDSHGVRMLPGYITLIRNGKINPKGSIKVLKDTPVVAQLDGDLVLGSVIGVHSMNMATEKAKNSGIGFVIVRNSTHWGRPAYYPALAAKKGCIGICFTNTESNMPPWGGKEARLGNNPFCIGAPRASGDPVVLDMAMSQAAWGKIFMYQREGRKAPFGWGLDRQGNPTDDPEEIIKSKRILPMGQHKGAGLSFMIDLMTGILADGKFGEELVEEGKGQPWATAYTQAYIAIDIRYFTSLREFQTRVDGFISYVKSASCVEGFSEVNVPGERAWKEEARRIEDGIPIDNVTLDQLHSLAAELGIPLPS